MNCSEIEQTEAAERYLLGRMSESETQEYEAHLRDCEHCAGELEKQRVLISGIRETGLREMKAEIRRRAEEQRRANWGLVLKVAAVFFFLVLTPGLIYYLQFVPGPAEQEITVLPEQPAEENAISGRGAGVSDQSGRGPAVKEMPAPVPENLPAPTPTGGADSKKKVALSEEMEPGIGRSKEAGIAPEKEASKPVPTEVLSGAGDAESEAISAEPPPEILIYQPASKEKSENASRVKPQAFKATEETDDHLQMRRFEFRGRETNLSIIAEINPEEPRAEFSPEFPVRILNRQGRIFSMTWQNPPEQLLLQISKVAFRREADAGFTLILNGRELYSIDTSSDSTRAVLIGN